MGDKPVEGSAKLALRPVARIARRMDTLHTTSPTHAFPLTGGRLHGELDPVPEAHFLTGIAALLEPHKIFNADWHGLGVHVRGLSSR